MNSKSAYIQQEYLKDIIEEVAKKYNIPFVVAADIWESQFKFIKDKCASIEVDDPSIEKLPIFFLTGMGKYIPNKMGNSIVKSGILSDKYIEKVNKQRKLSEEKRILNNNKKKNTNGSNYFENDNDE